MMNGHRERVQKIFINIFKKYKNKKKSQKSISLIFDFLYFHHNHSATFLSLRHLIALPVDFIGFIETGAVSSINKQYILLLIRLELFF